MNQTFLTFMLVVGAGATGYMLAKRKFVFNLNPSVAAAIEQERSRTIQISKNAYELGCMQGFTRTCNLLKKSEKNQCVEYSKTYCPDAAANYEARAKDIIEGP